MPVCDRGEKHLPINIDSISFGTDVTIGSNLMIAGGVNIKRYDGHPSDPENATCLPHAKAVSPSLLRTMCGSAIVS